MGNAKELHFDILMANVKARTQQGIFKTLADEAASLCGLSSEDLLDIIKLRLNERTFGMGEGVAIFDVKSLQVKRPILALMTFDNDIDFNALDSKPTNIMAAVISPKLDVSNHLQRLASISRVLRSRDLCGALRDASDVDEMRVLFMSTQDWMVAA